jgi:hypothetical protein
MCTERDWSLKSAALTLFSEALEVGIPLTYHYFG